MNRSNWMRLMAKLRYSEIKNRIDVDALEEELGFEAIEQVGDEDRGYCLFPMNHSHGDTTGKFSINRDKRVYHCWVCGGGDFLSLAMETQGLDVDDAIHWLNIFTKDTQTDADFLDEFERDLIDVEERVETLPYFNDRVLNKWIVAYHTRPEATNYVAHQHVLNFLAEKWGISEGVAERYQIGYDEKHIRRVKGEVYEGPAIIFPHLWQGRLVGWQERWLEPDDKRPKWVPKYTNTTDMPRNNTIFNYDAAIKRSREKTVVIESVPTALALESRGYNAVSTFGSNVTPAQMRLLRRLNGGVILGPDNDGSEKPGGLPAGIKWRNALQWYLERYIDVELLPPPPGPVGTDLADVAALGDNWLDEFINDQRFDPLEGQ